MLSTPTIAPLAAPNMTGAIGWLLALLVFVLFAFIAVMRLRRWFKDEESGSGSDVGFTLSDFRRLHREGKMTDEEFERLRAKMVAGAKAMAQGMPDPLARKRPPARRPPGEAAGGPPQHPEGP